MRKLAAATLFGFALGAAACRATRDGQSSLRDEANPMPMSEVDTPPAVPEPYVSINGFEIARFEYWPFRWKDSEGSCIYPYPDAVQQGFDGGSVPAQKCMKAAYDQLWAILKAPPAELVALREKGGPKQFFLVVNDYGEAKLNPAGDPVASCLPEAKLRGIWHYSAPNGVIRWVSEVQKDGKCTLRSAGELAEFAAAELKKVE